MFQVEQKPGKGPDKNKQSDTNNAPSSINPAEMLREQNKAFQRNSGMAQSHTEPVQMQEEFASTEVSADMEEQQMKHPPAQMMVDEEEEIQAKAAPVQMQAEEEEEEIQAKTDPAQVQEEDEKLLQGKMDTIQMQEEEEEEIQPKSDSAKVSSDKKGQQTGDSSSSASSMSFAQMNMSLQAKMQNSFGTSFQNVNIHQNDNSATQMGALAYTQGNNVHFAPGQFNPNTQGGQELLGHELTHVVQQRQGRVQPTKQGKGLSVNDNPSLESEADNMGKKAANGQQVDVAGKGSGVQFQSGPGPSWWDSIKKGWDIYWKLNDEGAPYARSLMKHYVVGFGTTYRGDNLPWSIFLSARPEIQRAIVPYLEYLSVRFGVLDIGNKGNYSTSVTGVRLNELESMRWTLHGCHEIKLSLKYKIKEKNGVKCVVFYGIKMTWVDVGDLHPGIGTVDDSGNVTDDREFTGAGQSFPIEIDFCPSEYSVWKDDGTHIAGWPPITGAPKAGIRE